MEVVSRLHFPSDISICATFFPESHPLSPFCFSVFFWFQWGKYYTSFPPPSPPPCHRRRWRIFQLQSYFTSSRISLIPVPTYPLPLSLFQLSPFLLPPGSSPYLLSKLSCELHFYPVTLCPCFNQSNLSNTALSPLLSCHPLVTSY